jgi:transglutaminase-like putative cysteine protease
MRLDTWFRLFNHATLALACACLLQSERQFVPGAELLIVPVVGVVLVAFLVEGRWTMPDAAANLCGVAIAAGGVWWVLEQVYNPNGPVVLPMPTALVPHIGPMMLALMLVKLFRPRQPADFWVLQGMGLLQVALACVLAADPRFGLLLAGYVACGLTTLALHHSLSSESGVPSSESNTKPPTPNPQLRTPNWLWRPLLWTVVVGVVACLLFLVTPRGNWPSWDPLTRLGFRAGPPRAQTGFVAEEINLNRTGELDLDDEAAFTVRASDAEGRPKTDLTAEQRWRGAVLEVYADGRWSASLDRIRMPGAVRGPGMRPRLQERLPDFGPSEFYIDFKIQPRKAGGLVLAEPILFGRSETRLPVIRPERGGAPFYEYAATVLPFPAPGNDYSYRQVTAPVSPPDRLPADLLTFEYVHQLRARPPQEIRTWTLDLLRKFADEGRYGLTPADLDFGRAVDNDTGEPIPASAERVARALCAYLATSGEFGYTLDLRRQDADADPAVDFLCNVRTGACERFATGLVLMLRSCGIPARIVKGFHGAEHQGEGLYVVRHRDAHAWVEALVIRPDSGRPAGARGEVFYCDWLTLDPTPEGDATAVRPFSLWHWLEQQWQRTDQLWHELVLGLTAEHQADLWYGLTSSRGPGPALLRLLSVVLVVTTGTWLLVLVVRRLPGWWAAWRARRARPRPPAPPAWLARLFGLLDRHLGVRPGPSQTPRETAAAAADALRRHAATSPLAEVPDRVVELYYRFRYGGRPLSDDEGRAVEDELARLESALRAAPAAS